MESPYSMESQGQKKGMKLSAENGRIRETTGN